MAISKPKSKTIPVNSTEIRDIVCIPEWTKHHPLMDSPLDGEVVDNFDVFKAHQESRVEKCLHLLARDVIVIKLKPDASVWYETEYENLHELRRKWTAEKASAFSNNKHSR